MIKVTLANGETKEFDSQLSAFDAARELGEAKTACAAEIDGKVCDLRTTLTDGCTVKFLTFEDEQGQSLPSVRLSKTDSTMISTPRSLSPPKHWQRSKQK